ncbi:MAG TPA: hypothetical protein PKN75_14630 [Bacteroidia bacterium]|nr:hypothetical protein [Bacteroidia bacterium]HNU34821.1 hypothetical protein [Bacteroidia bacterium]
MNKVQSAHLNSFQETSLNLENGKPIWINNLTFKNNVEEFDLILTDIFKYRGLQVTDRSGAMLYKKRCREKMAEKSVKIRSAVQNLASDTDNIQLYKEVNFPVTSLLFGLQQEAVAKATIIAEKARANEASLAAYKVLPADLDAFDAVVLQFSDAIPMVDAMLTQRKNATANLKLLIKKERNIIETKLRKGATQFAETAPDFYNELLNSFRIKSLPTHFTEFDIVVSSNNEKLRGVKVTATSPKGEMTQFSNPIGEIEFKEFEPGYWDLTFECPGYVTKESKAVKADLGKKLAMAIELEKL